jgi:3-phenylpropionate/trans-cinnamate dioxygenase ferredoxin component
LSSKWIDVAATDSVSESVPLAVEADGEAIVLVRCAGALYAVEDRCTHDGESLAGAQIEQCEIVCPRHFSHFDLKSGEALSPPAYEPLRVYAVREANGRVLVEVPE